MNRHASINRVYRLIWSAVRGVWIPAAENSRGRGKRVSRTLAAAALALGGAYAQAGAPPTGPSGGVITAGSGSIAQAGALTTITQASPHLSLTWNSFNIPAQDTVDFVQPSASAIAVNRILDVNGTQILGHLNANGQVYLINPDGIVFGPGAEVNVGGLVASTLALDATDVPGNAQSFSAAFSGDGTGSVINNGTIHAASGGYVALLAQRVGNSGIVSAQLGTVALGAGSAATLTFKGTHLVSMQIDQSVLASVADNGGLIRADGGQVLMTAGAEKALLASVVNNTGIIEARTLDHQQGDIILRGGMVAGTVNVAGTLDASAPNGGDGGAIETSAAHVQITDSAHVTTAAAMGLAGSWLIDPTDFTISAGTTSQSASGIGATTLQGELANGNVAIATSAGGTQNGDIDVNAPLSWSSNMLTLTAANNINVNALMTVAGSAKVDFEPGVSGNLLMAFAPDGTFAGRVDISSSAPNALTIDGQVYVVINSLGAAGSTTSTDLQGINGNLSGNYALGSNIDASSTASWNSGAGFAPLGNNSNLFRGNFNGLGHTVNGLTINQPLAYYIGFIGTTAYGAVVENVGLTNLTVAGAAHVGGLEGSNSGVATNNSYATGSVSGSYEVGGLVGSNYSPLENSHFSGSVTGGGYPNQYIGGLVGDNRSSIDSSYATGSVNGGSVVGGLVGNNDTGSVTTRSYATATVVGLGTVGGLAGGNYGAISSSYFAGPSVTGGSVVGGLVGNNYGTGTISLSHAISQVNGSDHVGGLVGQNNNTISSSYATGAVVSSGNYAGGLVGANNSFTTISNSFATGSVTGGRYTGGLIGNSYGSIANAYATGAVSGTSNVGGLIGFQGNVGTISNTYATGSVTATGTSVGALVGANAGTVTNSFYDNASTSLTGIGAFGGSVADVPGTVMGMTLAQLQTQANFTSATGANGNVNPGWDLASTWFIYEGHTAPLLQVFMTPLTVSGTITQTYNASAFAPGISNLTYSLTPDFSQVFGTVSVTGTALGALHAGTYTFTPGGLYSDQLGYLISYSAGSLTIDRAPLTVAGSTASKVYDGTTVAPITGTLVGVLGGDVVTLTQAGSFASRNVGTGIAITANDSIGGGAASNYILVEPTGVTGTITPASLTVSGTIVGNKIYNGNSSASLSDGTLSGVIPGDSVTLIQSGNFASSSVGAGIAVTAADGLSGPSALDYSIIQPTGLTGTISPAASGNAPGTPGTTSDLSSPLLAAYYASAQIDANSLAPQWGAMPEVINASPTINVVATASEPASTDAGVDQDSTSSSTGGGVVINVAMKFGATGTLKIESGGLRLPVTHIEGNP